MKDLFAALSSEIFRPLVTLLIPGLVMLLPYRVVFAAELARYGINVPTDSLASLIFVGSFAIFVGLILEDFGSYIEYGWDQLKPESHTENWFKYLQLAFEREPVGHRYLRSLVLRLKFEVNTYLALMLGLPGIALATANAANAITQWAVSLGALCLALLLRYFAQETHDTLSALRARLLEVYRPPKRSLPSPPTASEPPPKLRLELPSVVLGIIGIAFLMLILALRNPRSTRVLTDWVEQSWLAGAIAKDQGPMISVLIALGIVLPIVYLRQMSDRIANSLKVATLRMAAKIRSWNVFR